MTYRTYIPAVMLATGLMVVDGWLLSGLNIITPSLLAIVILIATRYSLGFGWLLSLWSGLVLDLLSMQLFGIYIALSGVMFAVAYLILNRGMEISRFFTIGLVTAALVGTQLVLRMVLLFPWEGEGVGAVLLQYAVWQTVFTAIMAFAIFKALRVQ